ncbi:MAG: hypothetical protein ACRD2T_11230 [Thermoanaerobaculia bacterium]
MPVSFYFDHNVSRVVDDLELVAGAARPEELAGTVPFSHLR